MADIIRTPVAPIVVGLDVSFTGTGITVKNGVSVQIETISTTPKTCVNDLARLRYIADQIMKRIPKDVSMICIEDVFTPLNKAQIGSSIKLFMLAATVRLALYEAGLPFCVVSPGTLKKMATGSGAAQKSMVLLSVFKNYGVSCADDNQADSYVLAIIAEALVLKPTDLIKSKNEVLAKVRADSASYNLKEPL